jgi:hypothetical protein
MTRKARRRLLGAGLAVGLAVAVAGSGAAYAAWSSSGAGNAAAVAGTAQAPTTSAVSGGAFTSGLLYPGGSGDVKLTVSNPNPYPVRVTSVAGNGAVTASGGTGSCATTGVSFTGTTLSTNNGVAAGGSATFTLPGAATMSTGSDDGCQGALFTIPVTVTVVSG